MSQKTSTRTRRAITASLVLGGIAIFLAAANAYSRNRDRNLAIGAESEAQRSFFVQSVERPDTTAFFKSLTSRERQQAASNLSRYRDAQIAETACRWLSDFDPSARDKLSQALIDMARANPQAVVQQLDENGPFQKVAVFRALRNHLGQTLSLVVDALKSPTLRTNAADFLVQVGPDAGASVMRILDGNDAEAQFYAADVLGKLGYKSAGPRMLALLDKAPANVWSAGFSSLANLGWSGAEPLMSKVAGDLNASAPDRTTAILGLGRIATPSAVVTLWKLLQTAPEFQASTIQSLQLVGKLAWSTGRPIDSASLKVAAGNNAGTEVIRQALKNSSLQDQAISVSADRPEMVASLVALLRTIPGSDGRRIATIIDSLSSTKEGQKALESLARNSRYIGFIERQRSIARQS